jgi:hypothetical protein
MSFPKLLKLQTAYWIALANVKGWRSDEKIIVIESDDWGSARMPSASHYEKIKQFGFDLSQSPLSVDALETEQDLKDLFEVLKKRKDKYGRPACFTANMVMANPDYSRIKNSCYEVYHYLPTPDFCLHSKDRGCVPDLWREGLDSSIFVPQFHAREHVRWWKWLERLRSGSRETALLFSLELCGLPLAVSKEKLTFDGPIYVDKDELDVYSVDVEKIFADGIRLFQNEFKGIPRSTIAPNYVWTDEAEVIWKRNRIRYIQGSYLQLYGSSKKRRAHYTGEKNRNDAFYIIRNCNFEQNSGGNTQIRDCLRQMQWAFLTHQPVVLCSHRANYVGSINEQNRIRGISMLAEFLDEALRRWPDIVFLSTPELGTMIESELKSAECLPSERSVSAFQTLNTNRL